MTVITNTIKFVSNIDELRAALRAGEDQIVTTRASAEKLVQALGGDKLIAAAHRYTAAVQEIGGVARLTTAEQERVNAVVQKAIDKYTALGQQAPTALRQLADATKHAANSWDAFAKNFDVAGAIKAPLDTGKQALVAFAETLGPVGIAATGTVGAIAAIGGAAWALAAKAAATGSELHDMAEKTGLSVPALSRLSRAATVAGGDLSQMSSALFMFEERLGKGGAEFEKGLQRIGLSMAQVRAAGPDQWLALIAERFTTIHDPSARAAAAMELFGRQGREILPTLGKLNEALEMTADMKPWSEAQAKSAEEFEMKSRKLQLQLSALAGTIGKDLIPVLNAPLDLSIGTLAWFLTQAKTKGPLADIEHQIALMQAAAAVLSGDVEMPKPPAAPPGPGDQQSTSAAAEAATRAAIIHQQLLEGHLQHLRAASESLTVSQQHLAAAMLRGGDSAKVVAEWLGISEAAVQHFAEEQKKAEAAAKKHADALEHLRILTGGYGTALHDLGAPLAALIQADLTHGGTVADVAEKYHVAQASVEELAKQLKFADAVTEATTKAFHGQIAMLTPLTARFGALHDALHTLAGTWNEFHDGITVAGDEMSTVTIPLFSTLPNVVAQNTNLIEAATQETDDWQHSIDALASAFQRLAQITGDSLGGVVRDIANVVASLDLATKSAQQFEKAQEEGSRSGQLAGLVGMGTAVVQSTGTGSRGARIAGGALTGAQLGEELGGPLGAGIGAAAGGLIGLARSFGVSAAEKAGRETVKNFEQQIDAMLSVRQKAEAGGAQWKETAIGVRDAYLATGRSAAEADAAVRRLWDSSKKSEAEQQAAMAAITAAFDLQKRAAEALPGILKNVADGMNAISKGTVGALNDAGAAVDKTQEGSEQAFKKIAESGKTEFDRTGRLAVTAFNAALAGGKSFGDALTDLGPTFDDLVKAQGTFGYATTQSLQELLNFKAFASGPGKDVMSTLDGVNQMMSGLQKMGKLTQGDFDDLTGVATDSFNKMVSGGLSSSQSLKAMQPTLQKIWELHKDQGLAIDDNTQKLLDEAETNGTIGEAMRDPQQQMLDVMKAIAKALGADLPDAAEKGVGKVKDSINKIPKTIDVDFQGQFTPPDMSGGGAGAAPGASTGGLVTALGIQRFAHGGLVVPRPLAPMDTDTVLARLTPGELILNASQQGNLARVLEMGAATAQALGAGGKHAPVTFTENITIKLEVQAIDTQDMQEAVEQQILPEIVKQLEDRRRGFTSRLQQVLGS